MCSAERAARSLGRRSPFMEESRLRSWANCINASRGFASWSRMRAGDRDVRGGAVSGLRDGVTPGRSENPRGLIARGKREAERRLGAKLLLMQRSCGWRRRGVYLPMMYRRSPENTGF
jgi:hypothetical protein